MEAGEKMLGPAGALPESPKVIPAIPIWSNPILLRMTIPGLISKTDLPDSLVQLTKLAREG